MVESKAFLGNPKHECHVPQSGGHDCSAYNKKNRECNEYLILSHFMDEHYL